MSLASNLLQLVFSLAVGIASLLGALFIIGFLLAVPRNDFEDDNHEMTQPIFIPVMGDADCPIQTGMGVLPPGCSLTDTGASNFTTMACDYTVCDQCTGDPSVVCCCSTSSETSLEFMCDGENPRTFSQPDQCTCQPCEDVVVQLVFQVLSSTDGQVASGAQLIVTDSTTSSPSSLTMNSAGFFSTSREVNVGMATITALAPDHADREFVITILPPGPLQFTVTLSAVTVIEFSSNVNMSLDFAVDGGVDVTIPAGSVVTNDNQTYMGPVFVRTVTFTANQTTYSDDLPSEIITMSDEGDEVFYETRVLVSTQLVDDQGNPLSVRESLSLSVDLSGFDNNTVVTVLLYDGDAGTWSVLDSFTVGSESRRKRQNGNGNGNGNGNEVALENPNTFWAVATALNPSQICYLQVRTFERDDGLSGATISIQQVRDGSFFRRTGVTDGSTGPVGHSVCIEVLCDTPGTVEAEFNSASIEPRDTQPSGITISGNTITFNETGRDSSTPFYSSEAGCGSPDSNTFVSFEVPLDDPPSDIPPEVTTQEFWFIRAEVLSCFDSNMVTTRNVDTEGQTSIASAQVLGLATSQVVNIPAVVSPEVCNGRVTRRTVCIEAYANSMVTLEVQPHPGITDIGPLCYLSELTSLTDSATRTETSAQLDLTTLSGGNPMAGLYFGDINFVTRDQCQNPSSDDLDNPLRGFFAQFECFERPPDSATVELPAGCANETFDSQTCSQVPCTTATGDCTTGNGAQCCYREASSSDISIVCPPYNPLTLSQPQTCSCQPCGNIAIDVIVTVNSSADGSPVMGAMVEYTITGGTPSDTMTDSLGMATISATVSDVTIDLNITATGFVPEGRQVQLIPPGPLRLSVVLLSQSISDNGPDASIIEVGSIATVEYTLVMTTDGDTFMGNVTALTSYFAAEMPLSFDAAMPPPVVISDSMSNTYYAVRLIAATRLVDDSGMMPMTTSVVVETNFTDEPDNTLSLLTYDGNWMIGSSVTITPGDNNGEVMANAMLSDTELPWAIGHPVPAGEICYVQVRTFRRDNNPLSEVEVEVLQLFEQFGRTFFFRSIGTTGDGSVSTDGTVVDHAACLPVICARANEGTIRALYHVYLDANMIQPMGFYPAGQIVNINTTTSSAGGPLFPSQAECNMTSDGQYARFDLPIANPPPTDIDLADDNDGFVFLRVSWHDCFEYNRVSTISVDSSTNNILAIYSSVVTESGEINNGTIEDPTTSGGMPVNCIDGPMDAITARTACIQVAPNSNVTLQVELNPESAMYTMDNELCNLNQTIGSLMESNASDNRLRFDLSNILSMYPPVMNLTTLNNMGIYFDRLSANVAYEQCMNPVNSTSAELSGSIAIFDCHTI